MPSIIAAQFVPSGRLYYYSSAEYTPVKGDSIIVEIDKGLSIATVVQISAEGSKPIEMYPPIKRLATPDDLLLQERNRELEKNAYEFCLKRISERNMQMKLVKVEYQFDGSKAVFYFTADGRVDFRELVKDLAHTFHVRIEMRQIGVRDESKMTGGIGICGRELCCSSFLRDFQPVSVKMAKEQNLALNPGKISGQCGRLLCCLDYEYETYCCLRKSFPKSGKRVKTATHSGVVDKVNLLTGLITIRQDDGKQVTVHRDELLGDDVLQKPCSGCSPEPKEPAAASVAEQPRKKGEEQRKKGDDSRKKTDEGQKKLAEPRKRALLAPPPPQILIPDPLPSAQLENVEVAGTPGEPGAATKKSKPKGRFRKHGHRPKKQGQQGTTTPSGTPGA